MNESLIPLLVMVYIVIGTTVGYYIDKYLYDFNQANLKCLETVLIWPIALVKLVIALLIVSNSKDKCVEDQDSDSSTN